jgi:hypothetical protein
VNDNVTAAAINGGNEALRRDGGRDTRRELRVNRSIFEKRGSKNDGGGAEGDHLFRAFGRADPSANTAGEASADLGDQSLV